ncbi:MAG: hypothetical protein WBX09_19850 [Terracidiphilus sp.]
MRRASLRSLLQHPVLLVFAVRLPDDFSRFQFEHLLLAEADTDQVARLAKNAKQKANLFIDGLGGCLLAEPVVLILGDDGLTEIDEHLRAQQAIQVPDRVLGEDSGIWQPEFVGVIEILRHVPEGADTLAALVGDVVEAFFQLASAVLLRFPCDGFRRGFGGFADALPRKIELVPPHIATWKERHLLFSCIHGLRTAHRQLYERSQFANLRVGKRALPWLRLPQIRS